jgi:hypothetical protein
MIYKNPSNTNPIYPSSIHLSDICKGLKFRTIYTTDNNNTTGIFLGKPYPVKCATSKYPAWEVRVKWLSHPIYGYGKNDVYPLSDAGIIRDDEWLGAWTPFHITIRDTPEDIRQYTEWFENRGGREIIKEACDSLKQRVAAIEKDIFGDGEEQE